VKAEVKFKFLLLLFLLLFPVFSQCVNNSLYLYNFSWEGDISAYQGVIFDFSSNDLPYVNISDVLTVYGEGFEDTADTLVFNNTNQTFWEFQFPSLDEENSYVEYVGIVWLNDSFDMLNNFTVNNQMGRNVDNAFINVSFEHDGYVYCSGCFIILDSNNNEVEYNQTLYNNTGVDFNFRYNFTSGQSLTFTMYYANNTNICIETDCFSVNASWWADDFNDASFDPYWQVSEEAGGYVTESGNELSIDSRGVDGYAFANFYPFENEYFDVVVKSETPAPANLQDEPLAWVRTNNNWGVTASELKADFWTSGTQLRMRYKDVGLSIHCWDWTADSWGVGCADHGTIVAGNAYYYRIQRFESGGVDSVQLTVYDASFSLIEQTDAVAVSSLQGQSEPGYIFQGQPYTDGVSTFIAQQYQDEFGFSCTVMNQTQSFSSSVNRTDVGTFLNVDVNATASEQINNFYNLTIYYEKNNTLADFSYFNNSKIIITCSDTQESVFSTGNFREIITVEIPEKVNFLFNTSIEGEVEDYYRKQIPLSSIERIRGYYLEYAENIFLRAPFQVLFYDAAEWSEAKVSVRRTYADGTFTITSDRLDAENKVVFWLEQYYDYIIYLNGATEERNFGRFMPVDSETKYMNLRTVSYSEDQRTFLENIYFNFTLSNNIVSFNFYDGDDFVSNVSWWIFNDTDLAYYISGSSNKFTWNFNTTVYLNQTLNVGFTAYSSEYGRFWFNSSILPFDVSSSHRIDLLPSNLDSWEIERGLFILVSFLLVTASISISGYVCLIAYLFIFYFWMIGWLPTLDTLDMSILFLFSVFSLFVQRKKVVVS